MFVSTIYHWGPAVHNFWNWSWTWYWNLIVNEVRLGGVVLLFYVSAEVFGHRVVMRRCNLIISKVVDIIGRFLLAFDIINFCYIVILIRDSFGLYLFMYFMRRYWKVNGWIVGKIKVRSTVNSNSCLISESKTLYKRKRLNKLSFSKNYLPLSFNFKQIIILPLPLFNKPINQ